MSVYESIAEQNVQVVTGPSGGGKSKFMASLQRIQENKKAPHQNRIRSKSINSEALARKQKKKDVFHQNRVRSKSVYSAVVLATSLFFMYPATPDLDKNTERSEFAESISTMDSEPPRRAVRLRNHE